VENQFHAYAEKQDEKDITLFECCQYEDERLKLVQPPKYGSTI
jgi:hypothetical protein